MTTPIAPVRRPHGLRVHDLDEVRRWMLDRTETDVRTQGTPQPLIVTVAEGYRDELDLLDLVVADPDAHIGATLRAIARVPGVEHAFIVFEVTEWDHDEPHTAAAVLEVDPEHVEYCRLSTLRFARDDHTGLGMPHQEWTIRETVDLDGVPPHLREMVAPPDDARPARLAPAERPEPDIVAAYGTLPDLIPVPATPKELADLGARMILTDVLEHGLAGTIVLRFEGPDWQWWVLGPDQPTHIDDMVRLICWQDPHADAVVVARGAVFGAPGKGQPGVQLMSEHADGRIERWALLGFPDGPEGLMHVEREVQRELGPLDKPGWLGVRPLVLFDLTPLGFDSP